MQMINGCWCRSIILALFQTVRIARPEARKGGWDRCQRVLKYSPLSLQYPFFLCSCLLATSALPKMLCFRLFVFELQSDTALTVLNFRVVSFPTLSTQVICMRNLVLCNIGIDNQTRLQDVKLKLVNAELCNGSSFAQKLAF